MRRAFLAIGTALAVLVPATSAVGKPADPTATIGSTKGSGKGGCVTTGKAVQFTLISAGGYYRFGTTKVTLDGKTIATKSWPLPVSVSGGTSAALDVIHEFTVTVNLRKAKPGAHTLGLQAVVIEPFSRRAGAASTFTPPGPPDYSNGKVTASSRITKCTPKKKKPSYTG